MTSFGKTIVADKLVASEFIFPDGKPYKPGAGVQSLRELADNGTPEQNTFGKTITFAPTNPSEPPLVLPQLATLLSPQQIFVTTDPTTNGPIKAAVDYSPAQQDLQDVTTVGAITDKTIQAAAFVGDGSGLTNLPGGQAQDLQNVCNQGAVTTTGIQAASFVGDGSGLTNLPAQPAPALQAVTTVGASTTDTITAAAFVGDGSGLTNLPAGTAPDLQAVTTQGAVTSDTISAAAFIGDGSGLTNLPAGATPTLQDVTTAGATSSTTDISFTGSGTLNIAQDIITGSLLKINGGTGNAMVRIGEDSNAYTRTGATRSVLIGRNVGAFNVGADVVAVGSGAGNSQAADFATLVGDDAGQNDASTGCVALGRMAGENKLGSSSIAIGQFADQNTSQIGPHNNTIVINATGTEQNSGVDSSCIIKPIRATPDLASESLQLYYDGVSGELRTGAIAQGSVGSLSQVVAVGNQAGTIDLTQLDVTSIFLERSLNYVFPTTGSLITGALPWNSLNSTFTTVLPASEVKMAGESETWIANETIAAGDVVGLDTTHGDLNRVRRYQPATNETQNCMVIGVASKDCVQNGSCFVTTHGMTTVKSAGGTFNRGAIMVCDSNGAVKPGPLNANELILGYAMETSTTTAGNGLLCYIKFGDKF